MLNLLDYHPFSTREHNKYNFLKKLSTDLHDDQCYDETEIVDQVEQEPLLHRLDVGCLREGVGLRQVDRGEHHHDGDVDGQAQVILVLSLDEHRRLVDHVHQ